MKTSRPMASPRVFTRETLNTEVQTAKQGPDRANSAHSAKHVCSESRRMMAAIAILVAVVSVTCAAMPVFAQLPQGLSEALDNQKAGRLKEAVEIYTEVIAKDPRSAEAYNWRGMAHEDLGQLDQALADFNKAIEISPDYADAYNNRGEIYRKKNMIPQAFADYRKAAELDKKLAEAHYNMGLMNETQKKDGLAIREYETYLKLRPDAADKQQILDKIEALKKTAATQPAPPPEKKPGERPGVPKALPEKKAGEVPGVQKSLPEKKAGEVPGIQKSLPEKKAGERPGLPKPGVPMKPATPPSGVDLGVPGVPPIPVSPDMLAAMAAGGGVIGLIISILSYLFPAIMLFLIARKTNTNLPWLAFIPIAQIILALNIARKPIWWILLFLLPVAILPASLLEAAIPTGGILPLAVLLLTVIVAIVATLLVCLGIARERGKSGIWGVLLFIPCTSPIALAYLGLSK